MKMGQRTWLLAVVLLCIAAKPLPRTIRLVERRGNVFLDRLGNEYVRRLPRRRLTEPSCEICKEGGVCASKPEVHGDQQYEYIGLCAGLVCLAGLMSGLNLGLMSIDKMSLAMLPREKKWMADRVKPLVFANKHLLLVTLLLVNAGCMEALPIFLDKLVPSSIAILISVTAVLIFGEIIPQAICVKDELAPIEIGASTIPYCIIRFFMFICFPICWPIAKLLDCILHEQEHQKCMVCQGKGHNHRGQKCDECQGEGEVVCHNPVEKRYVYTQKRLLEMVQEDKFQAVFGAGGNEVANMVKSSIKLPQIQTQEVMQPFEKVATLDAEMLLNAENIEEIKRLGHTRFPVYHNSKHNIIGMLFVKHLLGLDFTGKDKGSTVADFMDPRYNVVEPDATLDKVLNTLQGVKYYELKLTKAEILSIVHACELKGPTDKGLVITDISTHNSMPRNILQRLHSSNKLVLEPANPTVGGMNTVHRTFRGSSPDKRLGLPSQWDQQPSPIPDANPKTFTDHDQTHGGGYKHRSTSQSAMGAIEEESMTTALLGKSSGGGSDGSQGDKMEMKQDQPKLVHALTDSDIHREDYAQDNNIGRRALPDLFGDNQYVVESLFAKYKSRTQRGDYELALGDVIVMVKQRNMKMVRPGVGRTQHEATQQNLTLSELANKKGWHELLQWDKDDTKIRVLVRRDLDKSERSHFALVVGRGDLKKILDYWKNRKLVAIETDAQLNKSTHVEFDGVGGTVEKSGHKFMFRPGDHDSKAKEITRSDLESGRVQRFDDEVPASIAFKGAITLEDIIEILIGEDIEDEMDAYMDMPKQYSGLLINTANDAFKHISSQRAQRGYEAPSPKRSPQTKRLENQLSNVSEESQARSETSPLMGSGQSPPSAKHPSYQSTS